MAPRKPKPASYSGVLDKKTQEALRTSQNATAIPAGLAESDFHAREQLLATLEAERDALSTDRDSLREALTTAAMMLRQEDVGWATPNSHNSYGLTLDDLKKWSAEIRTAYTGTRERAANPHIRNGFMLRQSYVWMGGIKYRKVSETTRGRRGFQEFANDPQNARMFFTPSARRRREMALFADGIYLVVGDDKKKTLRSVPLNEITDTQRDATFGEDIVAYRWTRQELAPGESARKEKSYWVYVDWFPKDQRPTTIRYGSKDEPVLTDHTAFDLIANRPDGYAFGSPDAIAAIVWARVIRDLIMNGVKMQDALAMFAFRINAETKKGAENAGAAIAIASGAGNAATMGQSTNMVPLSSAGRGYDFDSIRFVVSTMAASLHVSGIALAADTAFAGSSYGAAQTLDLPTQLAMQSRREEHIELDKRVLRWLGSEDAEVYFEPYDDATAEYRAVQAAMLAWNSGVLSVDDFRSLLQDIFGHGFIKDAPRGVLMPNNRDSLPRKDVDADGAGGSAGGGGSQAAAPDQGQGNGAGDAEIR